MYGSETWLLHESVRRMLNVVNNTVLSVITDHRGNAEWGGHNWLWLTRIRSCRGSVYSALRARRLQWMGYFICCECRRRGYCTATCTWWTKKRLQCRLRPADGYPSSEIMEGHIEVSQGQELMKVKGTFDMIGLATHIQVVGMCVWVWVQLAVQYHVKWDENVMNIVVKLFYHRNIFDRSNMLSSNRKRQRIRN